ncbi:Asp23/Gls24 family envelope stress response protein [Lentisphaerota bacterium ZTH]|nr:Asp23/Gls24 family envelope stress response protein [Lentisphaerota bacterium]WET05283.1 Asp23/Gls24 family envelope stress response protein [Lentisphaerota bacterium ZTH]
MTKTASKAKKETTEAIACEKGTELGLIKIHENVVCSIVRKAALSVPGVSRLSGSSFVDNIAEIVGSRKIHDRAIDINMHDDKVDVEIKVNIKFDFKVPEVAEHVQTAIIEQVESVTGMTVTGVNVVVQEIEDAIEEDSIEAEIPEV